MTTKVTGLPGQQVLRDEADVANRLLRAFEHMRAVARRLRQDAEYIRAAEVEEAAWELLADAPPVRASYARSRLGVSDPTLRSWIARGIVQRAGGRPLRLTLTSVARAEIETRRIRAGDQAPAGRGITDLLARGIASQRALQSQSFRRSPRQLGMPAPADGHRTAERRSVALHEQIAARLDEQSLAAARRRVRRWLRNGGPVATEHAKQWDALLGRSLEEIRATIVQDTPMMRELRQDTPFAGTLSEAERHHVLREIG